jgi:hypothetical protein
MRALSFASNREKEPPMRRFAPLVVAIAISVFGVVFAQSGPQKPARPPALAMYELYAQRVLTAADQLPPEAYASRLAPGVRSFAEAVGHTIDTNFGVCAGARGLESPKKRVNHEQSFAAKTELLNALRAAVAYCTPFVAEAAAAWTHASDLNFINTHNAQMLVIMDAQLIAQGLVPAKGSEAAAPVKK